jgi:hypothetical protein
VVAALLQAQSVATSLGVRLQVAHAAGPFATVLAIRGVELSSPC